jgi:hypothetical protein
MSVEMKWRIAVILVALASQVWFGKFAQSVRLRFLEHVCIGSAIAFAITFSARTVLMLNGIDISIGGPSE